MKCGSVSQRSYPLVPDQPNPFLAGEVWKCNTMYDDDIESLRAVFAWSAVLKPHREVFIFLLCVWCELTP